MTTKKKTIKIGLSDWEVARLDDDEKVIEIVKIPGLTKASLSVTVNTATVRADDEDYIILDGGITGVALTIGVADIPSEARKLMHGIELEDGMEIYKKAIDIPYTATIFRTRLNSGKYVWFGLAKGKYLPSGYDLNTLAETPSGQEDSVTANFEPRGDEVTHIIGREDNQDFDIEKFRQKIFRMAEGLEG